MSINQLKDYSVIPDEVLCNPTRFPIVVGDVAYVRLTQGMFALIDAVDAEVVGSWGTWYASPQHGQWYAIRHKQHNNKGHDLMHEIICEAAYGHATYGYTPDHINGTLLSPNILDNRRPNLRWANRHTQGTNRHSRRNGELSSQYEGVYWYIRYGKWVARLMVEGHSYYLGQHDSDDDAATCYLLAKGLWEHHRITPSQVL